MVDALVVDRASVDEYVRDARLAVLNATAYVVLTSSYAAVRVVFDVPYLRASVGLYLAVCALAVIAKHRVAHERLPWLLGASVAGLVAGLAVLVALVQVNRGTLFAEAAAALVAFVVVHLVDRAALAHA